VDICPTLKGKYLHAWYVSSVHVSDEHKIKYSTTIQHYNTMIQYWGWLRSALIDEALVPDAEVGGEPGAGALPHYLGFGHIVVSATGTDYLTRSESLV
jgi:hypothetical protein